MWNATKLTFRTLPINWKVLKVVYTPKNTDNYMNFRLYLLAHGMQLSYAKPLSVACSISLFTLFLVGALGVEIFKIPCGS